RDVVVLTDFSPAALQTIAEHGRARNLVVFLPSRLSERDRAALDNLLHRAREWQTEFIAFVSNYRAHLGDRDTIQAEEHVLARATELSARPVIFRPGEVLSPSSRASALLRRFGFCYPLLPRRLRGCFLDAGELYAAIEAERQAAGPCMSRVVTL